MTNMLDRPSCPTYPVTLLALLVAVAASMPSWTASAQQTENVALARTGLVDEPVEPDTPHPLAPYVWDRLEIGVRALHVSLSHPRRGKPVEESFAGAIDRLDPEHSFFPPSLYVHYALNPYFGVGLMSDSLTIATKETLPESMLEDGSRDVGDIEMTGIAPFIFGRTDGMSGFHPFAELGLMMYNVGFDPHPESSLDGQHNKFVLDDTTAFFLGLGVEYLIVQGWSVELYWRSVSAEIDGAYHYTPIARILESFTFDVSHTRFGVGARYSF